MHIPVLKKEVLRFLNPQKNENFVDCTAGCGGHSKAILEKNGPKGKVLAIEWDKFLCSQLEGIERLIPVNESYVMLEESVKENNLGPISGVLFDLGFSSYHIDEAKRGFSFMRDEPLDMRYNQDTLLTAKEIVNSYPKEKIKEILIKWGEEEYAEDISSALVSFRKTKPIGGTLQLLRVIEDVVPDSYRRRRISCATKTFQALRIAVNGEIFNIREGLSQALQVVQSGGKIVVISFHGTEDNEVIKFFKQNKDKLNIITSKAVTPQLEEVKENIRSRSAKLRVAIKK